MDKKSHKGFPPRLFRFLAVAAASLSSSFFAQAASTTLMWDPSPGANVAGYKVRYGTSSRNYTKVLDVQKATQATVPNLAEGSTYYFAVTAYNSAGLESTASNEVSTKIATTPPPTNQNPVVSLTSPAQSSRLVRGSRVSIAASASDADGTVTKVAFYVGGNKISEDTTSPYTASWTPTRTGSYSLVARATDDKGAVASSQTVTVQVTNGSGGSKNKPPKAKYTTLLAPTSGDSTPYAGAVTLNTRANGTYSGTVTYEGKKYQVKGRLDEDGKATKKINRKGKSALIVNIAAGDDEWTDLSGTISDGTTELEFAADRTAGKSEQSARSAGTWSVLLPPVEPTAASNSYPQGTSYAKVSVNKKGVVRLTGTLSDGTPIAQGGQLVADGKFLVYIPLYGKKGVLAGELQFPTSDSAEKVVNGSLYWHRPAVANQKKSYNEGFELELDSIGEIRETNANGGGGENPRAGAAMSLTLTGADLGAPIQKRITFNQKGKPQPTTGPERLQFEFRKNGKFRGSYRDPATTKRHSFSGFFLQNQNVGAGYFLSGGESGSAILETAE